MLRDRQTWAMERLARALEAGTLRPPAPAPPEQRGRRRIFTDAELAQYLAKGLKDSQIARMLSVGGRTVSRETVGRRRRDLLATQPPPKPP